MSSTVIFVKKNNTNQTVHLEVDDSNQLSVKDTSAQTNLNNINTGISDVNTILTDKSQKTRLVGNTNHTLSGTDTFICADTGGRLYITNDTGLPINFLLPIGSAQQSMRGNNGKLFVGINGYTDISDSTTDTFLLCDSEGFLKTNSSKEFSSIVTLLDNQAVGTAGATAVGPVTAKYGEVYKFDIKFSENGSWTCRYQESIDNASFLDVESNINFLGEQNILITLRPEAPYFRLILDNTHVSTQYVTIKYVKAF